MSLEKAIKYKKEKRKPYTGAKSVCQSCRNHGGEDWSLNNRIHKYRKKETIAKNKMTDYLTEK